MPEHIEPRVGQEAINKALWAACDTFRGSISAENYKDYIFAMLFLKVISDDWNERCHHGRQQHDKGSGLGRILPQTACFVVPEGADFNTLWERRHEPGNGERLDNALHAIEEANGAKLKEAERSVFQDIFFNSEKIGDEKRKNILLRRLLEDFARPELDLRPRRVGGVDVIGGVFECLIGQFAADGGPKGGEFYTPPEVSELIAELLDPQVGDTICDPACGSGSLLIRCGRLIRERSNSRKYTLYGQEAIGATWSLAKMNMFLHGEDNHQIAWGDTIRNPKLLDANGSLMRFDIVVANPPFSLDKWGYEEVGHDPFGRFRRGIPPRSRGDYAFILHMIETLKPPSREKRGGRMGVVAPHGVLFRGAGEGRIRRQLIEENLLDAVIGLPEKLFYGTGIPAAILIFKKQKDDDEVLFIDASREFKAGKNQNLLTVENVRKIISTFRARQSVDKYARLASHDEIRENDYNLNIPRYVDTIEVEKEVDLIAMHRERISLKKQLTKLEVDMARYLRELGYEP